MIVSQLKEPQPDFSKPPDAMEKVYEQTCRRTRPAPKLKQFDEATFR